MKEIGKDNINEKEIETILNFLRKEDAYHLEHDIKLTPEWIRVIMCNAVNKKETYDNLVNYR